MIEVLLRGLGGDENYVVDPFQDRLLAGQKATHMNVMLIDAGDFGRWHEGHLGNDPARDDLVQTQFGDRHGHRGVYRKKKDLLALVRQMLGNAGARSEERGVGKECVSTLRAGRWPS